MVHRGEFAALGVAVLGASTSVMMAAAGRRAGTFAANFARLLVSLVSLLGIHFLLFRNLFPTGLEPGKTMFLAASGLLGLALGDALLLWSMSILGPRVALLMMSLSPLFATVLAWVTLGQALPLSKIACIGMNLAGIAIVIRDRWVPGGQPSHGDGSSPKGVLLGIGAALGDAVGMVFSRVGMEPGLHVVSANLVRVGAAVVGTAFLLVILARHGRAGRFLPGRGTFALVAGGAVTGPVFGVLLALYAISNAPLGVAATLMSLAPILMLPISVLFFRERVSFMSAAGTLLATVGTCSLFLT